MAHLKAGTSRTEATPPEWLPLGAQVAEQCNTWAERHDIVGFVGKGAGSGSPACFKPDIAEVELNLDVALGEGVLPKWVGDFTSRATHFEYPVAAGALLHEAAHARWSNWNLPELHKHDNKLVIKVVELFEETRIEGLARRTFPRNRSFLRACSLKIVLGELDVEEVKERKGFGLSLLLLLSLARVDIKVLEADDVAPVAAIAEATFGKVTLEKLRDVWMRAQAHEVHTEYEPLVKLAEEWIEILKDSGAMTEAEAEAGAKGMPMPGPSGGRGGGEPGEEGEPSEEESEAAAAIAAAIEEMLEAMAEAAAEAEAEAHEEAAAQESAEAREAEVASRAEASAEEAAHEAEAGKMFAKGTGPSASRSTASRLAERRPPTSAERVAAVKVGQLLEKARYSDRVVTPVKTSLPPGRLMTRAAVQGVADIQRVGMTSVTPWHAKKRKHVEDPELKLGVVVDISGSMGAAMGPMAVTAWIFSEAARRIQAKASMIYYGSGTFAVLRPGQHLPEVNVYTAPDGTERFNEAFKATDGALNLLHGSGARLLVICSDMHYTGVESNAAKKWITRLIAAGVAVVIMPFNEERRSGMASTYEKLGATVLYGALSPDKAAVEIGRAAAAAIEKASGKR